MLFLLNSDHGAMKKT